MADGYKTKIYMDPVDDNVKSSVADQDGMARTMLRKDRTEHSMTGQTTMLQFVTATSTARKRGLELEQEELRPEVFSGEGIDMNMVEEKPLRNILQAKSRKKKSEKRTDEQNKGSVPMDLDDFGEADFLVPVDEDEEGMRF